MAKKSNDLKGMGGCAILFLLCVLLPLIPFYFAYKGLKNPNISKKGKIGIVLACLFYIVFLAAYPGANNETYTPNNIVQDETVTSTPEPAPTAEPTAMPEPTHTPVPTSTPIVYVYIPQNGSKYHSYSTCSRMKNPQKVTLEYAINHGYTNCNKC